MIQGIDKLKQKLADDLQVKKQKIDEQTEAEIVKIQEKYAKEILAAQAAEAKWQEQYKEQEAKRLQARINLEQRRLKLESEQEIIDKLLADLLQKLVAMPREQKLDYYVQLLPEKAPAKGVLLLSRNDSDLLNDLLQRLSAEDQAYSNMECNLQDDFQGGVKLKQGNICDDYSFEELLHTCNYELLQLIKKTVLS